MDRNAVMDGNFILISNRIGDSAGLKLDLFSTYFNAKWDV